MASKLAVAGIIEGNLSEEGLAAIGRGTALTPAWSGAPALSVGAPTSAGIWTPV